MFVTIVVGTAILRRLSDCVCVCVCVCVSVCVCVCVKIVDLDVNYISIVYCLFESQLISTSKTIYGMRVEKVYNLIISQLFLCCIHAHIITASMSKFLFISTVRLSFCACREYMCCVVLCVCV